MMGRTHATSGPVLALGILPLVNEAIVSLDQAHSISGVGLVGYGLLVAVAASLAAWPVRKALRGPVVLLWIAAFAGLGWWFLDDAGRFVGNLPHLTPVHGWSLIPYVIGSAAGAMLSDFDHEHATIAQSLGFVTKALAKIVGIVSGGHRNGTHSLLGILVFTVLTWFIANSNRWAYGLWCGFLFAVATAALRLSLTRVTKLHTILCLAAGASLTILTGSVALPPTAVTAGVMVGVAAHIMGDMLTKEGCPLGWPGWRFRFKVANLTTDTEAETVVFLLLCAALPVMIAWRTGLLAAVTSVG